MKKTGTATIMAMMLVVGTGSAALAHYVYERAKVWENGRGDCVINRSEVSHGGGGGYSKVDNETYEELNTPYGSYPCTDAWELGPKYKRNKIHFLKNTSSGWSLCWYSKWTYNAKTVNKFGIYWNFGSSTPCGKGYYATHGHVENRINRNDGTHYWVGGPMWSGSHYLPAT